MFLICVVNEYLVFIVFLHRFTFLFDVFNCFLFCEMLPIAFVTPENIKCMGERKSHVCNTLVHFSSQ